MHPCKSNWSFDASTPHRRLVDLGQLSGKRTKSGQNPGHDGANWRSRVVATRATDLTIVLSLRGARACSFAAGTTPVRDDIGTLSLFDGRPEGLQIRSEPIEPARAPPSNKTLVGLLFYMNGVANLFDSMKQLTSIHLKLIPTLVISGSVNV